MSIPLAKIARALKNNKSLQKSLKKSLKKSVKSKKSSRKSRVKKSETKSKPKKETKSKSKKETKSKPKKEEKECVIKRSTIIRKVKKSLIKMRKHINKIYVELSDAQDYVNKR